MAGGGKVRLHNLFKLQGKEHNDVPDLPTGGIGAVAKVDNLRVGDTLRSSGSNITIAPVSYPRPVAEVAITPRSHHDEEKALHGPASDRGGGPDHPGRAPLRHR